MKSFDQTTKHLYVIRISNILISTVNEAHFDRQKKGIAEFEIKW